MTNATIEPLMAAMMLFALVAAWAPLSGAWATFSRAPSFGGPFDTVEITRATANDPNNYRYRLRLTTEVHGKAPQVTWASSADCPIIRQVMIDMKSIEMPRPAPYGVLDIEPTIVTDGTIYTLSAPSNFVMGHLTITSNYVSPLSKWIDAAFDKLKPCWKETDPG